MPIEPLPLTVKPAAPDACDRIHFVTLTRAAENLYLHTTGLSRGRQEIPERLAIDVLMVNDVDQPQPVPDAI